MTEATAHIRRLFLDPKNTYSDVEAAEILSVEPLDLKRRMESGAIEGVRTCCGMTVSRKRKPSPNSSASPTSTYASAASRSSPWNALRNAPTSPSTPSSLASCATLSPPNRISSARTFKASPSRFAGRTRSSINDREEGHAVSDRRLVLLQRSPSSIRF
jgi:hypothetical protein